MLINEKNLCKKFRDIVPLSLDTLRLNFVASVCGVGSISLLQAQGHGTDYRPPPLPPLHVAKAGRNHLNEKITTLLPTGTGERYSQTMSNLGYAALLCRCELPLQTKVLNQLRGLSIVNSLLCAQGLLIQIQGDSGSATRNGSHGRCSVYLLRR